MTTVVVGGHARNVGKTSLVAAILAGWTQLEWTAVKISSHGHKENGPSWDAATVCCIEEELTPDSHTDTGRYLAAGAARAFWVRVREGRLQEAMPQVSPVLQSSPFVIVESNGAARYVQPDLFLMIHRYDIKDYKESARHMLPYADAIVALKQECVPPDWGNVVVSSAPVFPLADPVTLSAEFKKFLTQRLGCPASHG